jgi:signal transduction histidine kinase/ABC-type uncharacterized transport system substrate-binding protein
MKNMHPRPQFTLSFCLASKLHLFLFAFVLFFLFYSLTYGTEIKEEKRILILFPGSGLPAYPSVVQGIKSSLKAGHEFHIEYFIEYMDYYRNPDQTHYQFLLDLYHHKFSRHKIDLVIAYSAPSLSLVLAHANDLFPQTPVIFSAILREQLKGLHLSPMVTGVLVDIDYAGLLETALKIHPQTRHVAIVNGASKTDLLFEKEFRKALAPYAERLDFIYLTRLPMGDIVEKVQNLPDHSVVLYYLLSQDGAGKGFPPWEAASMVAQAANAPVYGCLDSYFGHDIVGGRLTSMEMTGIKAGEMALRILRGEKPSDIPMSSQGTIIDMFDWRQFKRFRIREDRLPPGSVIRYRGPTFWEEHRGTIIAVVSLIIIETSLMLGLLINFQRRRRAEHALREHENELMALTGRLIHTQEEELRRLSRDLHDDLTQRLAVLAIDAGMLQKAIRPLHPESSQELADLKTKLIEASDEVHALSRQLHPSILEDLGLVQAVQSECDIFSRRTGITVSFEPDDFSVSIPHNIALCLYRVLQEGLQNISKHSKAAEARVVLGNHSRGIQLSIQDSGAGFDVKQAAGKAGIGLSSMRERVRLVNGTLSVLSGRGKGTKIEVFIPLGGNHVQVPSADR